MLEFKWISFPAPSLHCSFSSQGLVPEQKVFSSAFILKNHCYPSASLPSWQLGSPSFHFILSWTHFSTQVCSISIFQRLCEQFLCLRVHLSVRLLFHLLSKTLILSWLTKCLFQDKKHFKLHLLNVAYVYATGTTQKHKGSRCHHSCFREWK